jgi:hypothetical protein
MTAITPVIPGFDLPVIVFAKDQPEYLPLPCHRQPDGTVTIRWKLSWRERFAVLFGGCIWHTILTFNGPIQPIRLETSCPIFGHAMGDEEI